jgi:uncharacterized iron-regulated protein
MLLWTMGWALAGGGACERIGFAEVVDVPAPAVLVLGERHGVQPDLMRAARVMRTLAERGPVTVALEAVHERYQPILDGFARGEIEADDLEALLEWETSWGFSYRAYAPLVTAASEGARVIAAGLDLGPRPETRGVPLPGGYREILAASMGGHPVTPGTESDFLQAMAWRDFRIAELGVRGWDGQGVLLIVTGRGHVEGGLGVSWQAQRMTPAPVRAAVLKPGRNPPCWEGDRLWR